ESNGNSSNISPTSAEGTLISNPASEYCIKVGGNLETKVRGDGGAYSVCTSTDNMSCEEWALYKRECPVGGMNITGYDTQEQIYCALTGGKISTGDSSCKLPSGRVCPSKDLYNGECPAN